MRIWTIVALFTSIGAGLPAHGFPFADAGFESYSVAAGDYSKSQDGPWVLGNDACVTRAFAPNSSRDVNQTWSAAFTPVEGAQYASVYAGGDSISQPVVFGTPTTYAVSVWAAAPSGTVAIHPGGTPLLLRTGEFTFTLDGVPIGNPFRLAPGTSWTQCSADFTILTPGTYRVGVATTLSVPYFINFDAFSLIPEPPVLLLFGLSLPLMLAGRRQKAL